MPVCYLCLYFPFPSSIPVPTHRFVEWEDPFPATWVVGGFFLPQIDPSSIPLFLPHLVLPHSSLASHFTTCLPASACTLPHLPPVGWLGCTLVLPCLLPFLPHTHACTTFCLLPSTFAFSFYLWVLYSSCLQVHLPLCMHILPHVSPPSTFSPCTHAPSMPSPPLCLASYHGSMRKAGQPHTLLPSLPFPTFLCLTYFKPLHTTLHCLLHACARSPFFSVSLLFLPLFLLYSALCAVSSTFPSLHTPTPYLPCTQAPNLHPTSFFYTLFGLTHYPYIFPLFWVLVLIFFILFAGSSPFTHTFLLSPLQPPFSYSLAATHTIHCIIYATHIHTLLPFTHATQHSLAHTFCLHTHTCAAHALPTYLPSLLLPSIFYHAHTRMHAMYFVLWLSHASPVRAPTSLALHTPPHPHLDSGTRFCSTCSLPCLSSFFAPLPHPSLPPP